jgi:two-component system, NarL family, sensor histidine kinase UhpB
MGRPPVRVLLIEDDEDDFVLVRDLLSEVLAQNYELKWVQGYDGALEMVCSGRHDVCLLDYRLGNRDGLGLLQEAMAKGCKVPVIFLTGQGDYQVDVEAMRAGAVDFLAKNEINARLLERSMRYAIERKRIEEQLQASITKLSEAEQAIREKMSFLQHLMDTIPSPIFHSDATGRYRGCNRAFLEFFALKLEQVIGKTVFDILPGNLAARCCVTDPEMLQDPGTLVYETALRMTDGASREIICNSAPFFHEDGRLDGLIGVIVDITERKRNEEALRVSEQRLRDLSLKLFHVQEQERTRLAEKLHDSIGQTLAAIKYRVEHVLGAQNRDATAGIAPWLEPVVTTVQEALEEVRDLYMDLRPTILDDFGIAAALGWLAREFAEICPQIRIEKQIIIDEQKIDQPLKVTIYRVVQEALRNLAQHSRASNALLSLKEVDGRIDLVIEDDGQGFDVQEVFSRDYCKRGLGLASMKEKVKYSGGSFAVESDSATGTKIHARWLPAA